MARSFGGRFSPEGSGQGSGEDALREAALDQAAIDNAGTKANILVLPSLVLAIRAFFGGPLALVVGLIGAGALVLAAWLLREGLRAQAAYDGRPSARRPLPRKMLAALFTAGGVFLASWLGDGGFVGPALYGLAAAALMLVAFGLDPLTDKRVEGVDNYQQDRVARVVVEAEAYLTAMREAIEALGIRPLEARVAAFQAAARRMIANVEQDPRDLTEARRYLGVYLMGARDASIKFADLYRRQHDEAVRSDYEALLVDLEKNFGARTDKMMEGDREGMDIEIKVLRDRLSREGIKTD